MAIKALNLSHVREYICKNDRDSDEPTVWKLGTLTSRQIGEIRDAASSFVVDTNKPQGAPDEENEVETKFAQSKMCYDAARQGLRGWDNFLDPETDAPIPFESQAREIAGAQTRVVPLKLMDRIPQSVIMELGQEILNQNEPTEDDGKNSSAPSSEG